MTTLRVQVLRRGLVGMIAALSLFSSAIVFGESTPAVAPGLNPEELVSELHSGGFEAKIYTDAPLPNGVISQVLTGASGFKILIHALACPAPATDRVCALTFLSLFADAGGISGDGLSTLNAATFTKVLANMGTDGKQAGFRVFYAYPCQGLQDAKFAPMVLRAFGESVATVVAKYRSLIAASSPPSGSPTKPNDVQASAPTKRPDAKRPGAQEI